MKEGKHKESHSSGGSQAAGMIRNAFYRFNRRFHTSILVGSAMLQVVVVLASVAVVVSEVVYFGYEHTVSSRNTIYQILRVSQILFLVNILYNLIFNFRDTRKSTRPIKWVADSLVLISGLVLIYPHPQHPWIGWLADALYSKIFLFGTLLLYSVLSTCYSLLRMLNKRTNPTLLMAGSFLVLIIAGAFVLMMPKCNYGGISFTDSLFLSTSAVCITGLTTVDISQTLTPTGIVVLSFLMQTGALGIMTFTSFFALFFSGNTTIYSQLMVKDMIYTRSINSLLPTLLYILTFTLVVEALGAVAIFFSIHDLMPQTTRQEILFSMLHSLSAFCNAGFSNVEGGLSNPYLMHSSMNVYIVLSVLIFAGAVGFPVLVNFKDAVVWHMRNVWRRVTLRPRPHRVSHLYNLNTRLALVTTVIVLVISYVLFLVFEWNNTLAGMTLRQKAVQGLFLSLMPRSSGFSSVNPAEFLNITILMTMVLMWIGGASQSTAGGVKVNTIATLLLNLRAMIRGQKQVNVFSRSIGSPSLRRAGAIVALSIISYIIFTGILVALEPDMPLKSLFYESASALFTVGSSLGITSELSVYSKLLLSVAMFVGRIGLLSLLTGLYSREDERQPVFPTDEIVMN